MNKPIRLFHDFIGVIDAGDGIKVASIIGYGGVKDLHATTSRLVGQPTTNDKGVVVRFETLNTIYVRINEGAGTP